MRPPPKGPEATVQSGDGIFRPGQAGRLAEAIVTAWYPMTAPELYRRKLVEAIRTALLRAYGQGRADSR